MDGDPPVETSGAANREARQRGLVGQRGSSTAAGSAATRRPPWVARSARLAVAHPASKLRTGPPSQRNGRWMGSVGLVRWQDALLLRRKWGAKAFCLAGSMMTADGGFWMAGGQEARLAHHWPTTSNTTPTTTAPHKCPTWGIDQPNRTMHPLHRSLALNMVPKGDPRDRGFRTVFTHRKQASASDHTPQTAPPHHKPTHPTQFEIQIPEFR